MADWQVFILLNGGQKMNVLIDDAIVIAVGGLVAKEATALIIKLRARRNGNGKDHVKGLLTDIKGLGSLTLEKVGGIEKEQGEIKLTLKGVTTDMVNFREKCMALDGQVKQVEERVFDHIRNGG
jgi:hypothetical protein